MIAKLAEEQDFDFYYKLKCDDENVLWSGHMNAHDKVWLEKRRYLNYFTFRPRRNLIKEFYNKHFNKE